jgi:deoxycytidine triphosphate deaminase
VVEENSESSTSPCGRILTGQELIRALSEGSEIFRDGSWSPRQIRGAGYDLRLAADMMVIPKAPESSEYRTVDRGDTIVEQFTLAPGDTALVSTVEKFSMEPWIAAQVSAKFGLAARGLLLLSGTAIHPGYGRTKPRSEGAPWEPRDDERLYLVMANVGPDEVNLRCGDTIAHLQFFELDRDGLVGEERNISFEYLRRNLSVRVWPTLETFEI